MCRAAETSMCQLKTIQGESNMGELVMDSIVDNIETNKGWLRRLLLTDNDNKKLDVKLDTGADVL